MSTENNINVVSKKNIQNDINAINITQLGKRIERPNSRTKRIYIDPI